MAFTMQASGYLKNAYMGKVRGVGDPSVIFHATFGDAIGADPFGANSLLDGLSALVSAGPG